MVEVDFAHTMSTKKGHAVADPTKDYWTLHDVADHWDVSYNTVRTYRSRNRGELPPPDATFGRSPVWKPQTIITFQRPGQGARTDLKDQRKETKS